MNELTEALDLLQRTAFDPNSLPHALEQLSVTLGYRGISVVDVRRGPSTAIVAPEMQKHVDAYIAEGWHGRDERAQYLTRAPSNVLLLDHQLIPDHVRSASAAYREYYEPRDLKWSASWKFSLGGESWRFTLARSGRQGPIDTEEAARLERLRPVADSTMRMAHQLREGRANGLAEGASLAGQPSIIINHQGRVSFVSAAAEMLMDSSFGISRGRVWAADQESNVGLRMISGAARELAEAVELPNVVIRRGPGRRPVLVQPAPVRGIGLDSLPGARIVLMLTDLGREAGVASGDLRSLFQLSSAEAEVAAAIARGLGVQEIADRRGVARETVRVQIKSLFRKMDANKQSDVVRLVDRIARLAPEQPDNEQ